MRPLTQTWRSRGGRVGIKAGCVSRPHCVDHTKRLEVASRIQLLHCCRPEEKPLVVQGPSGCKCVFLHLVLFFPPRLRWLNLLLGCLQMSNYASCFVDDMLCMIHNLLRLAHCLKIDYFGYPLGGSFSSQAYSSVSSFSHTDHPYLIGEDLWHNMVHDSLVLSPWFFHPQGLQICFPHTNVLIV